MIPTPVNEWLKFFALCGVPPLAFVYSRQIIGLLFPFATKNIVNIMCMTQGRRNVKIFGRAKPMFSTTALCLCPGIIKPQFSKKILSTISLEHAWPFLYKLCLNHRQKNHQLIAVPFLYSSCFFKNQNYLIIDAFRHL